MKQGPPFKLSEETIQAIIAECEQNDYEKTSKTFDTCRDIINKAAARDYEARGKNIDSYVDMEEKTMRKYMKRIFPFAAKYKHHHF